MSVNPASQVRNADSSFQGLAPQVKLGLVRSQLCSGYEKRALHELPTPRLHQDFLGPSHAKEDGSLLGYRCVSGLGALSGGLGALLSTISKEGDGQHRVLCSPFPGAQGSGGICSGL